jgi:hypothetical protein
MCDVTEAPDALSVAQQYLDNPETDLIEDELPDILNDMYNQMFGQATMSLNNATLGVILRALQSGMSVPAEHYLCNRLRASCAELRTAEFGEGVDPPHFMLTVNKATQRIHVEHLKSVKVIFQNAKETEKLTFNWSLMLDMPSYPVPGGRKYGLIPDNISLKIVDVCCDPAAPPRVIAAAAAITECGKEKK